jgi:hypothetical protein
VTLENAMNFHEMTSDARVQQAIDYLTPPAPSFWRWDDEGRWLSWADGRTIAFCDEIAEVCRRMAPSGLPAFSSIVLLLAACRESFAGPPPAREVLLKYAMQFGAWTEGAAASVMDPAGGLLRIKFGAAVEEICKGLERVAQLPMELRGSPAAKALLAEVVFEGAERDLGPEQAAAVPEAVKLMAVTEARRASLRFFAAALDPLREGLKRVDVERLRLRAKTGLDQVPGAAPVAPPSQRIRELLAALRGDPELGGVARLAHDLMAAVHVPRALHAAEELPMGGVSDLTNRGPFDRLLVSELAHDDLTLAVRVAMNEALYLRRESPPRRPPPRRSILIDTGIRMWGLPRVFAAAAALALAATADPRGELTVHRTAGGARTEPVDLTTRGGLVALLESLVPDAHAGAAMAAYLKSEISDLKSPDADTETLLVTHPDVLRDLEFQRAVAAAPQAEGWFAATVDRDGAFELVTVTRAGRKPVSSAKLDLDELLHPGSLPSPVPLRDPSINPNLPAIFAFRPLPLRLPCPIPPQRVAATAEHVVGACEDGRLMLFDRHDRGGREVLANLPERRLLGPFIDEAAGVARVALHARKRNKLRVVTVSLADATAVVHDASSSCPMCAVYLGGYLQLIFRTEVWAVNATTGARHSRLALPDGVRWVRGRFFQSSSGQWFALAFDGGQSVLHTVRASGNWVFDRPGEGGGPWLLRRDGTFDSLTGAFIQSPLSGTVLKLLHASADGNRVAVAAAVTGQLQPVYYCIDLSTDRTWQRTTGESAAAFCAGPTWAWCSSGAITLPDEPYHHLLVRDRRLHLASDEWKVHRLQLNDAGAITLVPVDRPPPSPYWTFVAEAPPGEARYRLGVTEFRRGCRAFLDGRGMLHFKPTGGGLPEVSLTLCNGAAVSGWTSEGQTFGNPYFLDGPPTVSSAYAFELITKLIAGEAG